MADDTRLNLGAGGDLVATLDDGTRKHQKVVIEKLLGGAPTPIDVSNPMPISAASLPLPSGAAAEAGGNLAAIAASASVLDDWDETDRAKVNLIAGQAGVDGGSGTVSAKTQRVALATDVALPAGTNALGKLTANDGVDIGDVTVNNASGAAAVNVQDGGNSLTVDSPQLPAALAAGGGLKVEGVAGGVAQPISAASLPLPTGASTAANDTTIAAALIVELTNDNQTTVIADGVVGGIYAKVMTAEPASNAEGLVVRTSGPVRIGDGTLTATIRDTGTNDSLNVAIVDAAGNQVTGFGGGTEYDEDTAHVSGDKVTLAGVVQKSADAALSGDGDRSVLQVDANGYLKVNVKAGSSGATEYVEDAASAADPQGGQLIARRRDAPVAETTTDGDVTALNCTAKGEIYVKQIDSQAITGTVTANAGTNLNTSALARETGGNLAAITAQLPTVLAAGGGMKVEGVAGGVAQPVSAASLPLPAGASTLAEQQSQTTSLQLVDDVVHATNAALGKAAAIAGQLDDASSTAATEDNVASVRITSARALHVQLRSGSAEVGTSGAPVRTDPTGSTTQPVSGTVTANVGTTGGVALDATLTGGTQRTKLTDGSSNVAVATTTPGASDVGLVVRNIPSGTQAVSAASLPLPTGAATLAEQQTQTTALQLIDDVVGANDVAFSKAAAISGQFDDAATVTVAENNIAAVRITAERSLHVQLRSGSSQVGTSGAPIRTDPTGTTTQPVSIAATVTADTELPAAAALADATANPTTTTVGADNMLFNGTTWDRVRGDTTNGIDVDVTRVTGTVTVDSELPTAAALADAAANPTTPTVGADNMLFNGTTWDRARGDTTNGLDVDVTRVGGTVTVAGGVAHDAADSGNPNKIGGRAASSLSDDTMVADADRVDAVFDLDGAQITRPQCPLADILVERVSNTDGASTALSTFGATANARNHITSITVYNDSTANVFLDLRDGTAGSVIYTIPLPGKGGATISFTVPLRQPTANTALAFDVSAPSTTVYISLIGFKSKA